MLKNNKNDFIPRTYSVKGYKVKKPIKIGKILKYFTYLIIIIFILGVTILTATHLV